MPELGEVIVLYMDKVDFEYHFGDRGENGERIRADAKGVKVFPSVESLKKNKSCVEECGVVQVELVMRKVVQESKLP